MLLKSAQIVEKCLRVKIKLLNKIIMQKNHHILRFLSGEGNSVIIRLEFLQIHKNWQVCNHKEHTWWMGNFLNIIYKKKIKVGDVA